MIVLSLVRYSVFALKEELPIRLLSMQVKNL